MREREREREERRSEGMLFIRLNKGSSGDGGGGVAKPSLPLETVAVACPDHLVLAELPVAKSLGAVTASALSSVRSVGRRSRRNPGQKVHICVRCDFPIAIYGRINPCDHAFCMACARSVSSCFLCDERVQKIQTIKMMEGIFICAAPHCLKSFLKSSEFESHVSEVHADLLQSDVEMEGGNENDVISIIRPSSADPHRQSLPPESSTARAPPRSGFSPSSNSQLQDREERPRRHQSREQPPPRPPLQPRQTQYNSRHQNQPGDPQPENNAPQGFDKPYNWFQQTQNSENQSGGPRYRRDSDQFPSDKQTGRIPLEAPFSNYPPPLPLQPPNYSLPANSNQALAPTPSFSYPPFPTDGPQPYYSAPYEVPRQESVAETVSEHGSVLGIPPAPTAVASFPDNYPRPWGMTFMGMSYPSQQMGQGVPEGFGNPTDPHGGVSFFQGDYGRLPEGLPQNPPHPGKELEPQGGPADHTDSKGVLAPLPMSYPPPPLLPPPLPQQLNSSKFSSSGGASQEGQAYGWHNDRRE